MKGIFNTLFSIALAIFLTSAASAQLAKGTTEVIILHTNDMHSKIDNMGKLAWLADSLRATHPYVFLVAAGDNFTGNPVVDMLDDKGYPMIDLMNRCGFNLSAVGNHEFDMGQALFNKRREQASFPFISCNINASGAVLKQPEPYTILKAGKIRIPVLGIIQLGDKGLPDSHPSRLEGLTFTFGPDKALEYKGLKKKYGILLALSHLGIEDDIPFAQRMPELDLIIGGHSHTTMDKPRLENGVMIVQAGSGLRNVGKTTLFIQNNKVIDRKYELIPLASIRKTNPGVQALIDKYNSNVEFSKVIATTEALFSGEDEFGCMMTDAITHRMKVDFAFQNNGGIRISQLPAGNITLRDIYRLDPFGNQVVIFKMNAEEIKSLICNAFNKEKSIDLQASGMTYTVIKGADGKCADVIMNDLNGNPLDPGREYTVGVNSYISASYTFSHRDPGTSLAITAAQALIEYLMEVKSVNYAGKKRAFVQ